MPPVLQSHGALIKRIQKLFPSSEVEGGICEGVSMMAIQAFLADDFDTFNNRIEFMCQMPLEVYDDLFEIMKSKNVAESLEKFRDKYYLDITIEQFKDIMSFSNGVNLYLHPTFGNFQGIFSEYYSPVDKVAKDVLIRPRTQNSNVSLLSLLRPADMEKAGKEVHHVMDITGVYQEDELLKMLDSLEETAVNFGEKIAFDLGSHEHAITVCFDPKADPGKRWIFLDTNQLPVIQTNSKEAVEKIYEGLNYGTTPWPILMTTRVFMTKDIKNPDIDINIRTALESEKWERTPTLTSQHVEYRHPESGMSWVNFAAQYDDVKSLDALIDAKSDLGVISSKGTYPIAMAVITGNIKSVEALLKAGVSANQYFAGYSLLSMAVSYNDIDMSNLLLKYGADPFHVNDNSHPFGIKALHQSAQSGPLELFKLMYEKTKIKIGKKPNGGNLLLLAAKHGQLEIYQFLIKETPSSKSYTDISGNNAALTAAKYGQTEILKEIATHNPDMLQVVNDEGDNALVLAIKSGKLESVKYLLNEQFDFPKYDINGVPILSIAMNLGYSDIVSYYLDLNDPSIIYTRDNDDDNVLVYAAKKGDLTLLKKAIDMDLYLMKENSVGHSLMSIAARFGHTDIVKYLLESQIQGVNEVDRTEVLPLQMALRYKQASTARYLIKKGANVNLKPAGSNLTLIQIAAENKDLKTIRFMLENGLDIDKVADQKLDTKALLEKYNISQWINESEYDECLDKNDSILRNVQAGSLIMVEKELSEHPDKLNCLRRSDNSSLLVIALKNNHLELAKRLIELGADINTQNDKGESPLGIALESHLSEILELLLKQDKINVSVPVSQEHVNPLICALWHKDDKLVKQLLEKGVDINWSPSNSLRVLDFALCSSDLNNIRFILEQNADPNYVSKKLGSPLYQVVQENNIDKVNLFLEFNSDPNLPNSSGMTPLFVAAGNGNVAIMQALIQKDADVNQASNKSKMTPLMKAASGSHLEAVKLLIANGAKINDVSNNGWSALSYAAKSGDQELLDYLLASGANVKQVANNGASIYDIAVHNGHVEMANNILKQYPEFARKSEYNLEDVRSKRGWIFTPRNLWTTWLHGNRTHEHFLENAHKKMENIQEKQKQAVTERAKEIYANKLKIFEKLLKQYDAQGNLYIRNILERFDFSKCEDKKSDLIVKLEGVITTALATRGFNRDESPLLTSVAVEVLMEKLVEKLGQEYSFASRKEELIYQISTMHNSVYRIVTEDTFFKNVIAKAKKNKAVLNVQDSESYLSKFGYASKVRTDSGSLYDDQFNAERATISDFLEKKQTTPLQAVQDTDQQLIKAAQSGNTKAINKLLDLNLDINQKNDMGLTALHVAIKEHNIDTVRFLCEHNANLTIENDDGQTPYLYAIQNGALDIALYLAEQPGVLPDNKYEAKDISFTPVKEYKPVMFSSANASEPTFLETIIKKSDELDMRMAMVPNEKDKEVFREKIILFKRLASQITDEYNPILRHSLEEYGSTKIELIEPLINLSLKANGFDLGSNPILFNAAYEVIASEILTDLKIIDDLSDSDFMRVLNDRVSDNKFLNDVLEKVEAHAKILGTPEPGSKSATFIGSYIAGPTDSLLKFEKQLNIEKEALHRQLETLALEINLTKFH